ncbi:T9SS type A sorting domain-containing protein, partial [Nonlabens sp.]
VYNTKSSTKNNSTTIYLPELNTGTYILKINNNSKKISTIKKLIIK